MRIVIDMQGAQTESRFRGIGRYTMSLSRAMVINRGKHEILLALNGLFPETIEPIRAEFDGLLPQENIRVWYAPGPVRECHSGNKLRRLVAEHIREAFLASLEPDIIHISSLFEGYVDDAVTSINVFDQKTPVFVTLYDLIPLVHPKQYLAEQPAYKKFYLNKIQHLKKANGWFCISNATAKEAKERIELFPEFCVNISTACDENFRKIEISQKEQDKIKDRFNIAQPFILYTGGADCRKNLHGLIRAYAKLGSDLRENHQLVLAGKIPEQEVWALRKTAKSVGLRKNSLVFTGYIMDAELVRLYNLCKLFVFPSWHEGFGLPVLEAMSCGATVICGNTSSLPEVVCHKDALFDPLLENEVSAKLAQGLTDYNFRKNFRVHGREQIKKFSWQKSALNALNACENFFTKENRAKKRIMLTGNRPKLAYISPLPPQRTGIANYSAELLPELEKIYEIDVVVDQPHVSDPWIKTHCPIIGKDKFETNADKYDRLLFHFGNSPFHRYMFNLIEKFSGVICLHDFFMSGYSHYMEVSGNDSYHWTRDLYHSHGYKAVWQRFNGSNEEILKYKYPCNLKLLQSASGVVVHSQYSKQLAVKWYGKGLCKNWKVIPLLRAPQKTEEDKRAVIRKKHGFSENAFIVCTFGFIAPTKMNHQILEAWLKSKLSNNGNCYLVFVGENDGGDYGKSLKQKISQSGLSKRILITGWASSSTFHDYLSIADIAVQLRTSSRGETSATLMDCLNYGLATIVNGHGSLAELPREAVFMIDDNFEEAELISALEILRTNDSRRKSLGEQGQQLIIQKHSPKTCARQYAEAIEFFYNSSANNRRSLVKDISVLPDIMGNEPLLWEIASCIAQNQPAQRSAYNFFIDITATSQNDLKTGIERVARSLLHTFIEDPPTGFRIEPVYLTEEKGKWYYRYARQYALELLGCPTNWIDDEIVEFQPRDILFIADLSGRKLEEGIKAGLYDRIRHLGVRTFFIIFDLLPITMPQFFPPGADREFDLWLKSACRFADGAVCISKATADDLQNWMAENIQSRERPLTINWFHLGADIESSIPTRGLPENSANLLEKIGTSPAFLMVGTVEPRKGFLQVVHAFEFLWKDNINVNLVIVGKEGWKDLPDNMRRTIPGIVQKLYSHPESGKRLFWLQEISDEYLDKIYSVSSCLIAASEGEGFGLPLIESAHHNLPIIARDISVFREVAGEHAFYFDGKEPKHLARAVQKWVELYESNMHPKSDNMHWLTWKESTEILKKIILEA